MGRGELVRERVREGVNGRERKSELVRVRVGFK